MAGLSRQTTSGQAVGAGNVSRKALLLIGETMDLKENKILIQRYIEERWNQRKSWIIDELVAPNFVLHTSDGEIDLATFKEAIAGYLEAFPDSHVVLEEVLSEGDQVAIRYTFIGTHSAEFMGVKATGINTRCSGMAFYRIIDGRIIEGWFVEDILGLLQQIGEGH
jgi:predicted ester cyclase